MGLSIEMNDIEQAHEEWVLMEEPMGSFQTFIFAEYQKTLAEVKRLREAFVIAVRHVGYHHSQDDLWYALGERGMDDLCDDDEDFGEWEE